MPLAPSPRPWLNANEREHWGRRTTLSRWYREQSCIAAKDANVPPLCGAYVMALVAFKGRRRRDAENVRPTIKACVDGLVDAGVIPDDSIHYLIGPDIRPVIADEAGITLLIASKDQEEIQCLLSPESWKTLEAQCRQVPDGVPCDALTTVINLPPLRST